MELLCCAWMASGIQPPAGSCGSTGEPWDGGAPRGSAGHGEAEEGDVVALPTSTQVSCGQEAPRAWFSGPIGFVCWSV